MFALSKVSAEGQGRVTEITIDGLCANVRVLRDSLPRATGVTLVGDTVFALVGLARAVAVPYAKPTVRTSSGVVPGATDVVASVVKEIP